MYHSQHAQQDPNVLRVLVIGESKVGKTLLIRRLCHQIFGFSAAGVAASTTLSRSTKRRNSYDDVPNSSSNSGGGSNDPVEEAYYFGSQWGPTIGFEVDSLVREAYVAGLEPQETSPRHGGGGAVVYGSGRPEDGYTSGAGGSARFLAPYPSIHMPEDGFTLNRRSSLVAGGGGGPQSGRQYSGLSFRGSESGASSPVHPSSTTSRVNRSLYVEDDALTTPLAPFPGGGNSNTPSGPRGGGAGSAATGMPPNPRPVQQTVELYELGGTRAFSPECMLPLPLVEFDGVVLVYDRTNAHSTAHLAARYAEMRKLFAHRGPQAGEERVRAVAPRRPKLMLIGTQLQPSVLSTLLGSATGRGFVLAQPNDEEELDEDAYLPSDDALLDPAVRLRAQQQLSRRSSRRHSDRRGPLSRRLRRTYLSLLSLAKLAIRPSLVLSEQYQEERSRRAFRWGFRLIEMWAQLFLLMERVVMCGMAIVLFGVNQEVVHVKQPSVRAAQESIREDPCFIAQCHVCRLYSRFAFESSVDEIVDFFDAIHREKLSTKG